MPRVYVLAGCTIGLLVGGQSLWKYALASRHDGFEVGKGMGSALVALLTDPYVLAGVAAYICATLLWFEVLGKLELSKAFPLMSASYVLALVIGHVAFGEPLTVLRMAGVGLICMGVAFVGAS